MIHEHVFICWHEHQDEDDAKEIKASSIRAAAKKAVSIWRHENVVELDNRRVTVHVKDEARRIHDVIVTSGDGKRAYEAFI
jgi:hypothetical protein